MSIFVNGVDPGFANDALPLVLSGVSERIEEVRCSEVLNYNTYNQPMVLFDIMGFGRPLEDVPFLLSPGVLTMAWGSVVRQIAAGLGVTLTDVTEWYEREPAPEDFEVDAGTIEKGTAAALHFEVRGMVGDKAIVVLEHVTRLRDDLGSSWPQPAGQGCYRVQITGEPNYTLDLQLMGTDGDHNTAGLKATAMRLVNAVPAVVAAPPGLVTALDLPLITGRGLVATWILRSRQPAPDGSGVGQCAERGDGKDLQEIAEPELARSARDDPAGEQISVAERRPVGQGHPRVAPHAASDRRAARPGQP